MNYLSQLTTFLILYTLSNSDYQKSLIFSIIIDLCSSNHKQYNNNDLILEKPILKYDNSLKHKHINYYHSNNNLSRCIKNINTSMHTNKPLPKPNTDYYNLPTTSTNNKKRNLLKNIVPLTNNKSDVHKNTAPLTNNKSDVHKNTAPSPNKKMDIHKNTVPSTNNKSDVHKNTAPSTNNKSDVHKNAVPSPNSNIHIHKNNNGIQIISSIKQIKNYDKLKVCKLKNTSYKNDLPPTLSKIPLNIGKIPLLIGTCHVLDVFIGSLKFPYPINNVIITSNEIIISNNYLLADNFMGLSSALFYFEGYLKTTFYTLEPNYSSKCVLTSSYKDNIIYTPFNMSKYLNIGYLLENESYLLKNSKLDIINFTYDTSKELMKVNNINEDSNSYNNCSLVITLDYSINIYSK